MPICKILKIFKNCQIHETREVTSSKKCSNLVICRPANVTPCTKLVKMILVEAIALPSSLEGFLAREVDITGAKMRPLS